MSVTLHKNIPSADLHAAVGGLGPYTNATLRQAAVVTAADVNKFAVQSDTGDLWWLVSQTSGVGTWRKITTTADSTGTPLTLISSVPVLAWYRGDTVVTSTGVSQWTDKTGNGNHLIQATGASQPVYTAADSGLNSKGTLAGSGKYLNCAAMNIPVVYWMWIVLKQNTWTSGGRVLSCPGGGGSPELYQFSTTPGLTLKDPSGNSTQNSGAALTNWKRVALGEQNTTADFIKVGSVTQSGIALGRTTAQNNLTVFAAFGGSNPFDGSIAEIVITTGIPTSGEQSAVDGYGSGYYLPSILT